MNQRIWGPHGWRTFHTLYALPVDRNPKLGHQLQRRVFHDTALVLPCSVCRNCYKDNKQTVAMTHVDCTPSENVACEGARVAAYLIHNMVNKTNGKREFSRKDLDLVEFMGLTFFDTLVIPSMHLLFAAIAHACDQVRDIEAKHCVAFFLAVGELLELAASSSPLGGHTIIIRELASHVLHEARKPLGAFVTMSDRVVCMFIEILVPVIPRFGESGTYFRGSFVCTSDCTRVHVDARRQFVADTRALMNRITKKQGDM